MKKVIAISSVLLAVFFLAGCGQKAVDQKQSMIPGLPVKAPVQLDRTQSAPINPDDEIASWQTYKNDELGFEFKYPKDLLVEQNTNVDYFSLDIDEKSNGNAELSSNQPLNINFSAKKTDYKNTNDWFDAWKKEFEKPSNYEGTIIHPKVESITDLNFDGLQVKRYVPGGGIFPFSNICVGFVKNGLGYNICYGGGVKISDYELAKTGIDEYGQNEYDEKKLEDARIRYTKLFKDILTTLKFKK